MFNIDRSEYIIHNTTQILKTFEIFPNSFLKTLTYMVLVQICKYHNEECGGIFPSIHHMGEDEFGVVVTAKALSETPPGGQAGHDTADCVAIYVLCTDSWI